MFRPAVHQFLKSTVAFYKEEGAKSPKRREEAAAFHAVVHEHAAGPARKQRAGDENPQMCDIMPRNSAFRSSQSDFSKLRLSANGEFQLLPL